MKIFLFSLSCFLGLLPAKSQNLVINGSFEEPNVCTEIHQYCSPSAWFYIKNHPDGYSLNPAIAASDGKCILRLYAVDVKSGKRTYWQTMLLCPLKKGQEYKISVDMTAEVKGPNLNDVGFYFTDNFLHAFGDTVLQPENYISLLDAKVKRKKNGWFNVQKKFIADGHHQFLVLGNFSSKPNKDILLERNTLISIASFIDDLHITPTGKQKCDSHSSLIDSLYNLHDRHSYYKPPPDTFKTNPPIIKLDLKPDTLVLNDILFDFDKYVIKNPELFDQYSSLFTSPNISKIEVVGYTDDAGSEAYNLELSRQRAAAVARLLTNKFSISSALINSDGKGVSTKYEDKKLNRRVEIYIYRKNE